MSIRAFFNKKWIKGVAGTFLGGVLVELFSQIFGASAVTFLLRVLVKMFSLLFKLITSIYEIQLWFLILLPVLSGTIVFIIIRFIILRIQKANQLEQKKKENSFSNYTQDKFGELLYRWDYYIGWGSDYGIQNIRALCPKCKCLIVNNRCPICDKYYFVYQKSEDELKALIYHKIDQKFPKL